MKEYKSYEEIREDFLEELWKLVPFLNAWKIAIELKRTPAEFSKVWWTGISGHPRVIAIFRKYYFAIEQLNVNREREYDPLDVQDEELMWGQESWEDGPGTRRHVDVLIGSLSRESVELREIVAGLSFMPIGLDQEDYPV